MTLRILLSLSLVVSILGCKPQASKLDSLDNLAAGQRVHLNECRVSPNSSGSKLAAKQILPPLGKVGQANASALIKEVEDTLQVIPAEAQELFVLLNGRILIADNANEICTARINDAGFQKYFSEGLDEIRSCGVFFAEGPGHTQILNIVLSPDIIEIRHGLTRVFGGLIAEFMTQKLGIENGKITQIEYDGDQTAESKQLLASAFLRSLVDSKVFKLETLAFLFGETGFAELQVAIDETKEIPDENLFNYVSFENQTNETFADGTLNAREARAVNYIFAEAFDSYFCNSWGAFDVNLAKQISAGSQPLARLADLKNTRETMRALFGETSKVFEQKTWPAILADLRNKLAVARATSVPLKSTQVGIASNGSAMSLVEGQTSSTWAGTKAFFGSIWDNTGGAVGSAYSGYRQRVTRAVDKTYDGNIATTAAKAIGSAGAEKYGEYYDQKYQQTTNRINTMQQGGMTAAQANRYGVALAAGDILGATDAAEGVGGYQVENARKLSGSERVVKVATGVGNMAGHAAGVASLTGFGRTAVGARTGAPVPKNVLHRVGAACLVGSLELAGTTVTAGTTKQANGRLNVKKPSYSINPKHINGTGGAEVMPMGDTAKQLFRKAVPDGASELRQGYAKNWFATDDAGYTHRFQMDEVGKAHWNGSNRPVARAQGLKAVEAPAEVKERLGIKNQNIKKLKKAC